MLETKEIVKGPIENLESLIERLKEETSDDATISKSITETKIVQNNLVTFAKNMTEMMPYINGLKSLMDTLKYDQNNVTLYNLARVNLTSLSLRTSEAYELLEKQKTSIDTLRRYERDTRATLRKLLFYLKDVREEEERKEKGFSLVGDLKWELKKGETWILSSESAFIQKDVWRKMICREAYMLEEKAPRLKKIKDGIKTMFRRLITGEEILFDYYEAQKNNAYLEISSSEIGGNLYIVPLDRGPVIARKKVYFGSKKNVMLRPYFPSKPKRKKKMIYGPGYVFQKFIAVPGKDSDLEVILQMDGDITCKELKKNEDLKIDPRYACAWDETVNYSLSKFGNILDRLTRGSIPYWVEFKGPGRIWYSNSCFSDGYLGYTLTPLNWIHIIKNAVKKLLGVFDPDNYT